MQTVIQNFTHVDRFRTLALTVNRNEVHWEGKTAIVLLGKSAELTVRGLSVGVGVSVDGQSFGSSEV